MGLPQNDSPPAFRLVAPEIAAAQIISRATMTPRLAMSCVNHEELETSHVT
jgi:hypothetical protein